VRRRTERAAAACAGLLLDDVLRDTHPDVKVALERLDPQSYKLRQMRMRRALDLEMKHKQMPPEMQNYDPFRPYLRPAIAKARLRRIEREQNDF
jgi:ubiquinol-cytochrome c reductase subunit 7